MYIAPNIEERGLKAELDAIRSNVCRTGGALIECEQLRRLCPDHMSVPEQFRRIAELAANQGCRFAFLPDGTVRLQAERNER